jgi:hypothetical protein
MQPRDIRQLLKHASNGRLSAGKLQQKLDLPVETRRVRQILKAQDHLVFKKRKGAPLLTPVHMNARLEWARDKIVWTDKWQ